MCPIPLLLGLMIAVESALIGALIPLAVAVLSGASPFTSPASPALCIVASVFLGLALAAAVAAMNVVSSNPCTGNGTCGQLGNVFRYLLAAIILSIGGLLIATISVAAPSAIPFVGSIAVSIVAIACGVLVPTVPAAASTLGGMEACNTGTRSVASTVLLVLAVIVAVIAIPIAVGAGGAVIPPIPD